MSDQKNTANGQSTAIVKGPQARQNTLKLLFEKARPGIAAVMPRHLTADRLLKIALTATSKTPELLECSPESLLLAVMQSASLGLEPNTPLQLGFLVPYGKVATFIPGYRGLIRLAYQSGEVVLFESRIVYERDTCTICYGTDSKLEHEPAPDGDPGEMKAAYAVATMKNGFKSFEIMSRAQIEKIRDRSKASKNGPWVTDFEEMARKTTVRRLCKMLPLSEEKLAKALEHQARAEAGDAPDFSDVIDVLPPSDEPQLTNGDGASRTDDMKARLVEKAAS